MHLTPASRSELTWWIHNVETSYKNIIVPSPDIMLTTDASTKGWVAVLGRNKTGGLWDKDEREYHINYLEMKAVFLGLQSLCGNITQKHIRILSDNTTTVAYINATGGVKSQGCNEMAQQIWDWCIQRDIWLSACHIPGVQNSEADTESRKFNESTEWSLDSVVFDSILALWGPFQIDLFASRLNFKVANYVSWKPDPGATFINAFLMNWQHHYFYAFPPFSLISTCLQKIEQDQASGVLLVPVWKTQPWFTILLHLLIDKPRLLPQSMALLVQPHSNALHPLRNQMRLMACKVSGKESSREGFQEKLQKSFCAPGLTAHTSNMNHTLRDGQLL